MLACAYPALDRPMILFLAVSFEDPELEKARQARRIIEQTRL